jgi:hypothetical protein
MTPKAVETFISFHLGQFGRAPKNAPFSSYFTYEIGGVAGAGIEPATRGFSVHCSAN